MRDDDWDDPDAVGFVDVMGAPDAGGRVRLDRIARIARRRDVVLGVFTDEEVHWTSRDPAAPPAEFMDAPRLATYTRGEQDTALAATLWLLQARGEASYDPDTDELVFHGPHAVLGDLRNDSEAAFSLRLDVPGQETRRAGVFRVRHDLFLCEDVAPEGLHRFTFLSAENQAAWLAATIDLFNLAHLDSGPAQTAERLEELSPQPEDLAGRCRSSALLVGTDRDSADRSLTVYTTDDDGLWFFVGWTAGGTGAFQLANLGRNDAVEALLAFVASRPRG